MSRLDDGRQRLRGWEASRSANFYEDDALLRACLARRLGPERLGALAPALHQAGADSAGPISRLAGALDRPEALPRVESWSPLGERAADVVVHPSHHELGRLVWRSGVLSVLGEPGGVTAHIALTYLFALNGEVPHLCSLACTAGLVKALQRAGSPAMRERWLPRLLDREYERRWHAAQFLTEVQGGSDIGANACTARPDGGEPGAWRLSGEKWFCSNVGADLYAVSARPEGAPDGTPGIALFVVPRVLEDGRPNGVLIRRLKNKLGTRTLPTAELDFDQAQAWPLGRLEDGFKLMMGVIINTSRLAVAVGASGIMRRAWIEAASYARWRTAFGQRLGQFPAVREQLAEMRALGAGGLALTLFVAAREDELARAGTAPEDDALFRTAVNVAKYACSVDAGLVVHHAIEILGGNGTIEDFSPLPRLYREVPVQESWEGPHNTLMAQLLRDAQRGKMHEALLDAVQARLLGLRDPSLGATRERALRGLDGVRDTWTGLLRADPGTAALHVRRTVGRLARLAQVALLLDECQAAPELAWLPAAAQFLLDRDVTRGYDPAADPGYAELIEAILQD